MERSREMSTVVDSAIRAGKFPEARRAYWEKEMARDPEGTERLIASLEPGLPPGARLPKAKPVVQRGPIRSSAGLPLLSHPLGGYYVDASEARS
jgi:hypothetical protein